MKHTETVKIKVALLRGVDEVDRLLAAGSGNLELDFTEVNFISVEGLEWLEELQLRAQSQGATVTFINLQPEQYKVFKVAHIDSLLKACGAPMRSGPSC